MAEPVATRVYPILALRLQLSLVALFAALAGVAMLLQIVHSDDATCKLWACSSLMLELKHSTRAPAIGTKYPGLPRLRF